MGKLIVSTAMALDGVIESTEGWFIHSGEHEDESANQLWLADAMLLGRKTYQGLSQVWPDMTDDRGFADRVNSMPKHVASTTLHGPLDWNATLIEGDLAESVAALKAHYSGNLVMYGCGGLARTLANANLVDEFHFSVFPTAWGEGDHLFHAGPPVRLRLASTTMYRSGVALLVYRPDTAPLDPQESDTEQSGTAQSGTAQPATPE